MGYSSGAHRLPLQHGCPSTAQEHTGKEIRACLAVGQGGAAQRRDQPDVLPFECTEEIVNALISARRGARHGEGFYAAAADDVQMSLILLATRTRIPFPVTMWYYYSRLLHGGATFDWAVHSRAPLSL